MAATPTTCTARPSPSCAARATEPAPRSSPLGAASAAGSRLASGAQLVTNGRWQLDRPHWRQRVVPPAVDLVRREPKTDGPLGRGRGPGRVCGLLRPRLDADVGRRRGRADQLDDDLVADQRAATPAQAGLSG